MALPTPESTSSKDLEKNNDFEMDANSMPGAVDASHPEKGEHERQQTHLEKASTHASRNNGEPLTKIKTAQDWTGPDDPGNPLNWSRWKKASHFWPTAFMAFSVAVGSSIISPAIADLQDYFHVSRTAAIVPLTVYVVGLALGPVMGAPLSEKFGRSVVYKISMPVYILFLVGAGCTNTLGGLVVCRLLAGLAGAPVLAIGAGTNADLFHQEDRAAPSTTFISSPFVGPALGPIIGGFCAQYKGWRWTMWANVMIAGVALLTALPMQETYKKVILAKRAKAFNLPPPPGPKIASWEYVQTLLNMTILRPLRMLVLEPIVLLFAIYNTFTCSLLFAFFAAFPYTFGEVYGFNTWQSGLSFTGIGIGVLLACATVILCDRLIYRKKHTQALARGETSVAPEQRLHAGMMGAVGLPIGLFWFAWTAREDVHWISPILAGIPFSWGNLCLFLAGSLYQIDVYGPLNGASAMAANGLVRYILGGCFPLWTIQMYKVMGIGWATSFLGFVCVAMLPIPFVFFRYGPQIRAKSRLGL